MNGLEDRLRAYGEQLDRASRGDVDAFVVQPKPSKRGGFLVALVSCVGAAVAGLFVVRPAGHLTSAGRSEVRNDAPRRETFPEPRPSWPVPSPPMPGSPLAMPVDAPFSYSDTFGAQRMGGTQYAHVHRGVDIIVPRGSTIRAARSGVVVAIGVRPVSGPRVWLDDGDGNAYLYAGLSELDPTLHVGSVVALGQSLGVVRARTDSVPPYLHFEIHDLRGPINPTPVLDAVRARPSTPITTVSVEGIVVASQVAAPLRSLLRDARSAGFILRGSGYRSSSSQLALRRAHCGRSPYDLYVKPAAECRVPTARPGTSTHESGTGIDVTVDGQGITFRSPAYDWLVANASRYGFFTVDAEPWHWEYRCTPAAERPVVSAPPQDATTVSAGRSTSYRRDLREC